jgi:hypothetical protein
MANVQSLLPKLDELRVTTSLIKPDLILLTETWLNSNVTDSLLNIPGYTLFRHDRPLPRRGGGVAVYVKNHIFVRPFFVTNFLEPVNSLWCILADIKVIVLCIYVPPDVSRSHSSDVNCFIVENFDTLLSQYPDFDVIICGDFNSLPCNFSNDLNVSNIVKSPTRGNSSLDLFFASDPISAKFNATVRSPIGNSDHRSVLVLPQIPSFKKGCHLLKRVYDSRKHNIARLISEMRIINWHSFYIANLSSDEKCNFFHDVLKMYVDSCIPQTTVCLTERDKPWITPLLKLYIQNRWNAYRAGNFASYNYWKLKVKTETQKAKLRWSNRASTDSKNLWKAVSTIRGTKAIDPLHRLCSQLGGVGAASELINSTFKEVFVPSDTSRELANDDDDWDIDITVADVISRLHKIPDSKAPGSDGIPTVIYKALSSLIAGPLCHIFSLCVRERNFPTRWKHSHVSPIPKYGCFDIKNLRPISLLPLPSKLLEHFMLRNGAKETLLNSFGQNQFGGRPGSSTTSALIKLHDSITLLLDRDDVVGVQLLAYDYTKAFDKLRHDVIIQALLAADLPLGFVKLVQSYLCDRTQATKIGDSVSSSVDVPSGVPQGSILGPYLYCVVAASLRPVHSSSTSIKYIDDITFCIPILRHAGAHQVHDEHVNVIDWSLQHGLTINVSKSKSLLFKKSHDCTPIILDGVENVRKVRILGVMINDRLSWDSHVDNVLSNAQKRLYCLRILKPLLPADDLRTIYFLLLRSTIEYSSCVFVHLPRILDDKLSRFQNRVHKLICSIPKECRASDCACQAFPDLRQRRVNAATRLFLKAAQNPSHLLHDILPAKSMRSGRFLQPPALSSRRRDSFVPFVCALVGKTCVL